MTSSCSTFADTVPSSWARCPLPEECICDTEVGLLRRHRRRSRKPDREPALLLSRSECQRWSPTFCFPETGRNRTWTTRRRFRRSPWPRWRWSPWDLWVVSGELSRPGRRWGSWRCRRGSCWSRESCRSIGSCFRATESMIRPSDGEEWWP